MARNRKKGNSGVGSTVKVKTSAIGEANLDIMEQFGQMQMSFSGINELMIKVHPTVWEGEAATANKSRYIDISDRIVEVLEMLNKDTEILEAIGIEYIDTENRNYDVAGNLGNLEGLSSNAIS